MAEETKSIEIKKETPLAEEKTERIRERRVYLPRTDIYETRDDLVLVMDLPGADEKSVDIMLEKNVLTIKAYPTFERPENYTLAYAEYGEGDFERSFALSDEIDREHIEARVKNGTLYLRLPKAGAAKPTKIEVKAG
ncbi:Hsp20/alpha crystallin family protein [Anaerolinea thermophila]|uniref:Heat shock protein Hsp20 family protein n=1 Tax=Anaerolinea thermophila (strain DSM 14523 / JCM 11388 / NBRC 100420 / UNI-1) TaxID=926569 RepID=E8N0H7_ANATU|nr:Hsp20/alpha crystallin family protein [Anaerolinea thermophila]BAJ64726.1 heat shock protein Hsp20 family protein [Anaerolinea thermophila UNI-1]